jgi:UDP-N-acetylglucosamine 2-epimerase (non-hydrolysing)
MLKKIIIVFGTRPEAIKMAPLIIELRQRWQVVVCVTGQHRGMLDQVLDFFDIKPDYDLNVMESNQSLDGITSKILSSFTKVIKKESPDLVMVHGDTTTTFSASVASFYSRIKVAHVEAGLRTYDFQSPFPEEFNRVAVSIIASIHFAPTEDSRKNLLNEGISDKEIYVTGNTVIDAMKSVLNSLKNKKPSDYFSNSDLVHIIEQNKKLILVTGHRRENFGKGLESICNALADISFLYPDIVIVYAVHLNPNIRKPVYEILSHLDNVYLVDPLDYPCFIKLMHYSSLIITDSGGIQEEAPSLGKNVLVTREKTERNESFESGLVQLVGSNKNLIVESSKKILDSKNIVVKSKNPFGDGDACKKISRILEKVKL